MIYVFGSGAGWWLAIALIAAIREKLAVSDVIPNLRGMGITFMMTGLMSMAFQGFLRYQTCNSLRQGGITKTAMELNNLM